MAGWAGSHRHPDSYGPPCGARRSCPVPVCLPFADWGEASALLGRGPGVEPVTKLFEAIVDALAVLLVGVVVPGRVRAFNGATAGN